MNVRGSRWGFFGVQRVGGGAKLSVKARADILGVPLSCSFFWASTSHCILQRGYLGRRVN